MTAVEENVWLIKASVPSSRRRVRGPGLQVIAGRVPSRGATAAAVKSKLLINLVVRCPPFRVSGRGSRLKPGQRTPPVHGPNAWSHGQGSFSATSKTLEVTQPLSKRARHKKALADKGHVGFYWEQTGMFRLALIQMRVEGGCKEANLRHATDLIAQATAAGADVLLLPEAMTVGWTHPSARAEAGPR